MATIPDDKLLSMSTDITKIRSLLEGSPGYPGLCERHEKLSSDYYQFKRWAVGIVAFAVGSGLLGVGIFSLLKGG